MPPPELVEQVPIGSSSASMYPGYSPADHIYGEAASTFGKVISKTRPEGWKPRPDGPEYEIGQQKKGKLEALRGPISSSASDVNVLPLGFRASTKNAELETSTATIKDDGSDKGGNPFFVIDTKPTPVKHHLPERFSNDSFTQPEKDDENEAEALKMASGKPSKEDKKEKQGSKRKRDSGAQALADEATPTANGISAPTKLEDEKPKKKKSKNVEANDDVSKPIPKVATPEVSKNKKKSKKAKHSDTVADKVDKVELATKASKSIKKSKKTRQSDTATNEVAKVELAAKVSKKKKDDKKAKKGNS